MYEMWDLQAYIYLSYGGVPRSLMGDQQQVQRREGNYIDTNRPPAYIYLHCTYLQFLQTKLFIPLTLLLMA